MEILLCRIDCIPVVTRSSPGLEGHHMSFVVWAPLVTGGTAQIFVGSADPSCLGDSTCRIAKARRQGDDERFEA